jgi:hypothetical protein
MEIDKYIGEGLTSFSEFIEFVERDKNLNIKDDICEIENYNNEDNENKDNEDLNKEIKIIQKGSKSQYAIPEPIRKCTSINLHFNRLSNLVGLPILYYIKELNLSSNLFKSSDLPELTYLPSLTILDISGNMIHSVLLLPYLPQLSKLFIAFNPIDSFDTLYESAPNLVYLDIRGNNIHSIDNNEFISSISSLNQLTELVIDGKKLNGIITLHTKDIINIFTKCNSMQIINNKSVEEWNIDYNIEEENKSLELKELEVKIIKEQSIQDIKIVCDESSKKTVDVVLDNTADIPSSEVKSTQESETSIEFVNTPRFDNLAMKFRSSNLFPPNSIDNSLNSSIYSPSNNSNNNSNNNIESFENNNKIKIEVGDIEQNNNEISNNDNLIFSEDSSSYSLEMIDKSDIVEDLDNDVSKSDLNINLDNSAIKIIEVKQDLNVEKGDDSCINTTRSLINSQIKYCDSIYNIFDIGQLSNINTDNSITNIDSFVKDLYLAIPRSKMTTLDLYSKQEEEKDNQCHSFLFQKKQTDINECDKIYDLMDIKSESDNVNINKSIKTIPSVKDIIFQNKNKVIRKKMDILHERKIQDSRKNIFYSELDLLHSNYQSQMDTNIKLQLDENKLNKEITDNKIIDLEHNKAILMTKLQESTEREKNINNKYEELNETLKTLTLSLEEMQNISANNIKQASDIQNLEVNIEKIKNNSNNKIQIQENKIITLENQIIILKMNCKEKDDYIETYSITKENELKTIIEELKICKVNYVKLNQTNNNITGQNDKYIKTIEQLRSCISKFQSHINKLTKLPCQFCENNEQLNKIKNENTSKIEINNSQIIEIENELISQTEELKLIKMELRNKDIKNEDLLIHLKVKDKQLNDKIAQITELRNKLILHENENQRNQYSINSLEESLNKIRLIVVGLENELICKSKIEKELKKLLKELENN